MNDQNTNRVVIMFKGGRLSAWHQLNDQERSVFEVTHVDLMLSVARHHAMARLEGVRLIGP